MIKKKPKGLQDAIKVDVRVQQNRSPCIAAVYNKAKPHYSATVYNYFFCLNMKPFFPRNESSSRPGAVRAAVFSRRETSYYAVTSYQYETKTA